VDLQPTRLENILEIVEVPQPEKKPPATRRRPLAQKLAEQGYFLEKSNEVASPSASGLSSDSVGSLSTLEATQKESEQAQEAQGSTQDETSPEETSESYLESGLEEDIYARKKISVTPAAQVRKIENERKKELKKSGKNSIYRKEQQPDTSAASGSGTSGSGSSSANVQRYFVQQQSEVPAASEKIYLTKDAIETFEDLMAPSYQEKVKFSEYYKLLSHFIQLNYNSRGDGYLIGVTNLQNVSDPKAQKAEGLYFSMGPGETLKFTRRSDKKVCILGFHLPHEFDTNNKIPFGFLKDVRRIFKEYNITSDDLVEVRLNVQ
jgi:hypothetical protein